MQEGREMLSSKGFYLLILLVLLSSLLAYQVRVPYRVSLGVEGDTPFIAGFYHRERSEYDAYRWSGGEGVVRFYGIGSNQELRLRMRIHGAREEGYPQPEVRVVVKGEETGRFIASGGMEVYEFEVRRGLVGIRGDIEVKIEAETFMPLGDNRELGVIVDWVEVEAIDGLAIPGLMVMVYMVGVVVVVYMMMRWANVGERVNCLVSCLVVVLGSIGIGWGRIGLGVWGGRLFWILVVGYIGVRAVGIAYEKTGGEGRWGIGVRLVKLVMVALLLALMIRLALLFLTKGYESDIEENMGWAWQTTMAGLHTFYLEPSPMGRAIYPPFSLYIFRGVGEVYRWLYGPEFPPPWEESREQLSVMVRLPGVIGEIILGLVIFLYLGRRVGWREGYIGMVGFLFNPAVIFDSGYWGQTDGVHGLLVVWATIGVMVGRVGISWLLIVLGVMAKPQALVYVPMVAVITLMRYGMRGVMRGVVSGVVTGLALISPFIYFGTWKSLWEFFTSMTAFHATTTVNAHNLWWLVGLGEMVPDKYAPWFLPPFLNYRHLGLILLGVFVLFALWRLVGEKEEGVVWVVGAYIGFVFFMLPTQIHENYMYMLFPLLVWGAIKDRRYRVIYLLLSLTWLVNMVLHDPQIVRLLSPEKPEIMGSVALPLPKFINAMVNTVVLCYWTVLILARRLLVR